MQKSAPRSQRIRSLSRGLATASVALALFTACQSGPPLTPLERGDAAFAEGRFQRAGALYEQAAREQVDQRAEALHGAARVEIVGRRPEPALALFGRLAETDRDYFTAHARIDYAQALLLAGEQRLSRGKPEAAIEVLEALQRIDADHPGLQKALADALTAHGDALVMQGRRTEAMMRFEGAMALRPEAADAWVGAAEILIATGRHEEALALLGNARRFNPSDGRVRALTVQAMGVY